MKVAIPTLGKGGLDCERSGHFGHCDCFTVVDVEDGKVGTVSVIDNPPHEEGGMGMRPMMGFAQAGITVFFENQTPGVGDVAQMAAAGTLPVMGEEHACHH